MGNSGDIREQNTEPECNNVSEDVFIDILCDIEYSQIAIGNVLNIGENLPSQSNMFTHSNVSITHYFMS